MKKIIIIGSGARECALLMKMKQSLTQERYNFYTIGLNANPYMHKWSEFYLVNDFKMDTFYNLDLFAGSYEFNQENIEMVIIGPEAPIVNGLADWLDSNGIYAFAPSKENARIESSKIFSRNFIHYNVQSKYNPDYIVVKDKLDTITPQSVYALIMETRQLFGDNIVIKKDGLCGGKGVYVEGDHFIAINESPSSYFIIELTEYLKVDLNNIIIEKRLYGIEFSIMTLADSAGHVSHLAPVFDYKRLKDNDEGPNTGSMGSVIFNKTNLDTIIDSETISNAQSINEITLKNMPQYKGVLYGSYILTEDGALKLIEFNCRFGDPEGVLAILNIVNDLILVFNMIKANRLNEVKIHTSNKNYVGVYCVPESYPFKNDTDRYDIFFKDNMHGVHQDMMINKPFTNLSLVYGDCVTAGNHILTNQSRTLLLVSNDDFLYKAINGVYKHIDNIVSKLKYRRDIGAKYISKYEMAGVSITNTNNTLGNIKELLKTTYNEHVRSELGDFGGVYNLNGNHLVSSIDGVGTKTDFVDTYFSNEYESLGKDIVNHSINDILVMGAVPLFFLDYYGTSQLDHIQFTSFIRGASQALCVDTDTTIPLIGGETAEMPSVYKWEKNDIVGCIIGKLDNTFVNFPRQPISGDYLLGIKSTGPHTNGFSLINKIDWSQSLINTKFDNINVNDFLEQLKQPHFNYLPLIKQFLYTYGNTSIIRMCHITGGGLHENLQRVIPSDISLDLNNDSLEAVYPQWCNIIETIGNVSKEEMYRVFNCGIGFVIIVDKYIRDMVLNDVNLELFEIGMLK
jgi:phosphoribosylamine--glycine ligase/phosphoribosylaminoimidazole synthetase